MNRFLCAASLAAALAGCRSRAREPVAVERAPVPAAVAPEPPIAPELQHLHWTAYQDEFMVVQRATAPSRCTAVCTARDGQVSWSADECLSTREELHFLSPD